MGIEIEKKGFCIRCKKTFIIKGDIELLMFIRWNECKECLYNDANEKSQVMLDIERKDTKKQKNKR